jgi:hypothetical protein
MNSRFKYIEIKQACRLINAKIPADFLLSMLRIHLNKYGRGKCPFHSSESSNCFSYDRKRDRFHCFHCHRGWSKIDLYMEVTKVTFNQAIDELGSHIGIRIYGKDFSCINSRMVEDPHLIKIDQIRNLKGLINDSFNGLCEKISEHSKLLMDLYEDDKIEPGDYYRYQQQLDYEMACLDEDHLISINELDLKEKNERQKLNESFNKIHVR